MKFANTRATLNLARLVVALASVVNLPASGQAKPVYVKPEEAIKLLPVPLGQGPQPSSMGVIKAARMNGTVRADFTVLPDGRITDITNTSPASGNSFLFNSMTSLLQSLGFRPYMQDGLPVAMRTSLQATFTNGMGKWDWSDPSSMPPVSTPQVNAPPIAAPPSMADLPATTSQPTGASAGTAYKGPNADWVHMVLATVGPYKCDAPQMPKPPTCQRDAKVREAQMIAILVECQAASGSEESRTSAFASLLVLDLKAAHDLCGKAGEPTTCDTDTVLPCSRLPK